MANQNTAYGLRPIGLVGSATNSTGVTQYEIASDNTNAIYQYGLVTPTSDGVVDFAGATNGGTTPALGVLMGVEYQDATQKKPVFPNASLGTSARTGSTENGSSNSALGVSTIAVTATLPLRIVGIMDDEANSDFAAAGIPLIVRINAHFNANTSRFDSQTTATSTGV